MSVFPVKLPDVGEGIAEAELISWLVAVGDRVTSESPLAEVMTDKATVEIASPVNGVVTFLHGEPGEMIAVGTEFVGIEVEGGAPAPPVVEAPIVEAPAVEAPVVEPPAVEAPVAEAVAPVTAVEDVTFQGRRPSASPAVRQRARDLGIDLHEVVGTGPDGRIVHADLDRIIGSGGQRSATHPDPHRAATDAVHVEPVRGLRRRIAERLTQSWTEIPHITYVEEIDATQLEALRAELNGRGAGRARLTLLPFLVQALVVACGEQPRLNAHYDAVNRSLSMFDAIHVGIATQTRDGLMVPVLHHAEARGLWDSAAEITRLAAAARDGTATLDELSGSTITITSLGAMGGLVTTPIINRPEVAIVGVNKMNIRPVWRDGAVVPRAMFNLSSSFDHRIVDGWDAATFVQRLKALLEMPALLFLDE